MAANTGLRQNFAEQNNQRGLFRDAAAPWVEFQIFTAEPKTIISDITINRPRVANSFSFKSYSPQTAGSLMSLYINQYKKIFMVFRWVANAILHAKGIRETRPAAGYRRPALIALADAIKSHFVQISPAADTGFRNPMRLLVEMVYGNSRVARDDEASMLFVMLAEAVGIPCKLVLVQDSRFGWRAFVECQLDMQNQWMPFDFLTGQWGVAPQGQRYAFTADGGKSTVSGDQKPLIDNSVVGDLVVPRALVGSYNLAASRYWKYPKIVPSWYPELNAAVQSLPKDIHDPFLANKYFDHQAVNIAENFGPEVTGAIIAKFSKIYSQRFGGIFRKIIEDAAQDAGIVLNLLEPIKRAQLIADLVRNVFPYAEETVGVEEITNPLRMFWFYCYYPGVQKYDCDDLTTCWMSIAEANNLATSVRLAGDAQDPSKNKYHVYPVYLGAYFNNEMLANPFVYDVSAPTAWGVEMQRGDNYRDYTPSDPSTYEPVLNEQKSKQRAMPSVWALAAGPQGIPRSHGYGMPPRAPFHR